MAKKKREKPDDITLNITSMLDIVFQLIIFFLLVSNFAAQDNPPMDPPKPVDSVAQLVSERLKLVINVLPDEDGAIRRVQIGDQAFTKETYKNLTQAIKEEKELKEKATGKSLEVDLRADRLVKYGEMKLVMKAITSSEVRRVNLICFTDGQGPDSDF